jgi:hypothetical protein
MLALADTRSNFEHWFDHPNRSKGLCSEWRSDV